ADAGGAARGDHPIAFLGVHRHRLLAEDVLPRLRGGDGLLGVQAHGRRDVDGVDVGIGDERAPVWMGLTRADLAREGFDQIGAPAAEATSSLPRASRSAPATRLRTMSPAPRSPHLSAGVSVCVLSPVSFVYLCVLVAISEL